MGLKKIIGSLYLKLSGWKLEGDYPRDVKKMVMVAAPHTTNWDFPITMAVFLKLGIKIRFFAKKSLFKFPMGLIVKNFGGIPVDRSKKNNMVEYASSLIQESAEMVLLVPVEGTRNVTKEWKSGFYHIAQMAKVPIALGYLDYKKKKAGFFPTFYPTDNYAEDLVAIQAHYKHVAGKYPDKSALYEGEA